jgi:hypothetical protein
VAAQRPDKLAELIGLWFYEAGANHAFPLDDRSPLEILLTPRPQLIPARERYVYRPGGAEIPEHIAVNVRNRSFSIGALVDVPAPVRRACCSAHGSRFGGRALAATANARAQPRGVCGAVALSSAWAPESSLRSSPRWC